MVQRGARAGRNSDTYSADYNFAMQGGNLHGGFALKSKISAPGFEANLISRLLHPLL